MGYWVFVFVFVFSCISLPAGRILLRAASLDFFGRFLNFFFDLKTSVERPGKEDI